MFLRLFVFLNLFYASSGLCFGQSGAQVLQSTLQKMGGAERWQALRSLEIDYVEENQRTLSLFGYDSISNQTSTELKYYNYLDFRVVTSKNINNEIHSYFLITQDSTFVYVSNTREPKKNRVLRRKNDSKIDSILFHIQNIEFLPLLILDCLQGKVTYEYEGLKKVEEKEYHSFWLSYQGYSKPLHLLIGKDYMPYQYSHYELGKEKFQTSYVFLEYKTFQNLWLPVQMKKYLNTPQELQQKTPLQITVTLQIYLQNVKVNEAPPAEVLKILKR